MTTGIRKVQPGDRFRPSAAMHNATIDLIASSAAGRSAPGSAAGRNATTIEIRNDSGADLPRFGVVRIGAPVIDPATNAEGFLRAPAMAGDSIDISDLAPGLFAVAAEPIAADAIGRAVVYGMIPMRIVVENASHLFARVKTGENLLHSCSAGLARVIWKEAGTGERFALVDLSPSPTPLQIMAQIISASELSGEAYRWEYEWAEVNLSNDQMISEYGTRGSAADGVAFNAMEMLHGPTGKLGSGRLIANIADGFEPVPIGPSVVPLWRSDVDGSWHFSAPTDTDGACVSSTLIDGGAAGTYFFRMIDGGTAAMDPIPV